MTSKKKQKDPLSLLLQRQHRLLRMRKKIIKIYWEKIKDRPKYKDPNWYKK